MPESRFTATEEFLSLANWSVLKNPQCSNTLRSQLHRNFGKLYSAQVRGRRREEKGGAGRGWNGFAAGK
jgi:hypothetical protein